MDPMLRLFFQSAVNTSDEIQSALKLFDKSL